ncbi:uncharacterized protein LOC135839879 [Planococcus citri]|uniref:uncharacterized protein LOC135839879 n=1 Tax=Planococcus citri TaxID=170843 RepID=UPI0031F8AD39
MVVHFVYQGHRYREVRACADGTFTYQCSTSKCPALIHVSPNKVNVTSSNGKAHQHREGTPQRTSQSINNGASTSSMHSVASSCTSTPLSQPIQTDNDETDGSISFINGSLGTLVPSSMNIEQSIANLCKDAKRTEVLLRDILFYLQDLSDKIKAIDDIQVVKNNVDTILDKFASVNSPQPAPAQTDTVQITQPRILLVGDSHVRKMQGVLSNLIRDKATVQAHFRPGCGLNEFLEDIETTTADYTTRDCVIIYGGSNSPTIDEANTHIQALLRVSEKTNVIRFEIPFTQRDNELDNKISAVNKHIRSTISVINSKQLIWRCYKPKSTDYVQHGLHLHHGGKLKLGINMCNILSNLKLIKYVHVQHRNSSNHKNHSASSNKNISSSNTRNVQAHQAEFNNCSRDKFSSRLRCDYTNVDLRGSRMYDNVTPRFNNHLYGRSRNSGTHAFNRSSLQNINCVSPTVTSCPSTFHHHSQQPLIPPLIPPPVHSSTVPHPAMNIQSCPPVQCGMPGHPYQSIFTYPQNFH